MTRSRASGETRRLLAVASNLKVRTLLSLGYGCGLRASEGLRQLSRRLIDDVSAILPRAQAVSRMPSAIAALRMCCQRRVAAGTRWRMQTPVVRSGRRDRRPMPDCVEKLLSRI